MAEKFKGEEVVTYIASVVRQSPVWRPFLCRLESDFTVLNNLVFAADFTHYTHCLLGLRLFYHLSKSHQKLYSSQAKTGYQTMPQIFPKK